MARGSPIAAGTVVAAGLFRATVIVAGLAGPKAVRFDFTQNPDNGPLFAHWVGNHYESVALPRPGEALELPALAQAVGSLQAPAPTCP